MASLCRISSKSSSKFTPIAHWIHPCLECYRIRIWKRKRQGRPWWQEANHIQQCQSWLTIPRRSYRSLLASRQVRHPYGCRCPRLPCCRFGILVRRDFGIGWKCRSWQQEDSYHSSSHSLAVKNDEELNKLLGNVTIASGGVLPNIHAVLLPKKSTKGKGGSQDVRSCSFPLSRTIDYKVSQILFSLHNRSSKSWKHFPSKQPTGYFHTHPFWQRPVLIMLIICVAWIFFVRTKSSTCTILFFFMLTSFCRVSPYRSLDFLVYSQYGTTAVITIAPMFH